MDYNSSGCCSRLPNTNTNGCLISITGNCLSYTGLSIPSTGINTGDKYNKTINDLITYINVHVGAGFISSITTTGNSGPATVVNGVLNIPQYSGTTNTASDGITITSNVIKLGQAVGQVGNPAKLLSGREVPLNGFNVSWTGTGLFLIGSSVAPTSEKLQVFGTQRLQYVASTDITPQFLFANNTGTEIGHIRFDSQNIGSIYMGFGAGNVSTGNNNIGIGNGALGTNITGTRNIVFGLNSLNSSVTTNTNNNIVVGGSSLNTGSSTIADFNIVVGWNSLDNGSTVGTQNIVIGNLVNDGVAGGAVGTLNILVGNSIAVTGTNNTTLIGNGLVTNISNVAMLGLASQNVIVGGANNVADTGDKLQVYGTLFLNSLPSSINSLLPVSWDTVSKKLVQGAGGGLTNPMTTLGDIIVGGASGAPQRLAKGTETFVLTITGGVPTWSAPSGGGGVGLANDGLTLTSTTFKLGQTVSQGGNPAILLENREIPSGGFSMFFSGTGNLVLGGITDQGSAFQLPAGTATRAPLYIASGTLFTTLTSTQNGLFGEYDGVNFYAVPNGAVRQQILLQNNISSSATTLTLNRTARTYSFTGGVATAWTLPALAGNTGKEYLVKNRGTAIITLSTAGSDSFFVTGIVSSIVINPGEAYIVTNDGTYWIIM